MKENDIFYVADFYCASAKLVIELDGKHHLSKDQKLYDEERTRVLETMNLKVIRFRNEEIKELRNVLSRIEKILFGN